MWVVCPLSVFCEAFTNRAFGFLKMPELELFWLNRGITAAFAVRVVVEIEQPS